MTTEDDFQRKIDRRVTDYHTRLVLADFLDDRGDPRAEGYRAMSKLRRRPIKRKGRLSMKAPWTWFDDEKAVMPAGPDDLPRCWYMRLDKIDAKVRRLMSEAQIDRAEAVARVAEPSAMRGDDRAYYETRREAEDDAALAFWKMDDAEKEFVLSLYIIGQRMFTIKATRRMNHDR